jgi:chromosome segregation ATPase
MRLSMSMSETQPMTYSELADAIGRSEIAARSLAARKRWRRIPGNDGKVRLAVPVELLGKLRDRSMHRSANASEDQSTPPSADASIDRVVAVLEARISELQVELRETRATIETLSAKAGRVDVLEALLEVARQERDRWAVQAEQVVATVDPLKSTIEALKTALDAERGRLSELREERDHWRTAATARRRWWPWRQSA